VLKPRVGGIRGSENGRYEMSRKRRVHSAEFKAKVAMEAAKWVRTLSELSSMLKVHPTVNAYWIRQ